MFYFKMYLLLHGTVMEEEAACQFQILTYGGTPWIFERNKALDNTCGEGGQGKQNEMHPSGRRGWRRRFEEGDHMKWKLVPTVRLHQSCVLRHNDSWREWTTRKYHTVSIKVIKGIMDNRRQGDSVTLKFAEVLIYIAEDAMVPGQCREH